jgi:hypothetical protein
MRKLFWTCLFSGVVLAGGVISTAHFAVHHPDSAIGRVLHGASHVASVVNPLIGLTPLSHDEYTLAEEQSADKDDPDVWQVDPVAVPDDPVPAADDFHATAPEPGPIVVSNSGTAPIVICEEEKQLGNPIPEYAPVDPDLPIPTGPYGSICPTSAECVSPDPTAAPQAMPYCSDDEVYELLPMPAEELPVLHMPRLIEDADGLGQDKEPIHDGCFLPCHGCPDGAQNLDHLLHHTEHRVYSIFDSQEENTLEHPEIDTMEFRPSDGQLYDFGPGSL